MSQALTDKILKDTAPVRKLLRELQTKLHAVLGDLDGVLDPENDPEEILGWAAEQLDLARSVAIELEKELVEVKK